MFRKISLAMAKRSLKSYAKKISALTHEELGAYLAYACIIYAGMTNGSTRIDIDGIVHSEKDAHGEELSKIEILTKKLLKEYRRAGEAEGAAGTEVWHKTFQCLKHPELLCYGKEIWAYLSSAQPEAIDHLDRLESVLAKKNKPKDLLGIKNARKYIGINPTRLKLDIDCAVE